MLQAHGFISGARVGNRPGQALIGLSLAYENFSKPKSGLRPFIGLFFWPGLAYLKACTGLKTYLQAYFILKSLNTQFYLFLNRLNRPQSLFNYKALKAYFTIRP